MNIILTKLLLLKQYSFILIKDSTYYVMTINTFSFFKQEDYELIYQAVMDHCQNASENIFYNQ